ncbi:6-pyruvoyl trahydropterin synthase family protein [Streptosporangium saharense]|uniref:6-carboxy-5,6,7,8-tetrahydropterin synthase n=1 Tax=Streptosporangium saharense TaxID=1706840 RepID=A0A7W7VRW3_9ACTN|nr:6-carboxytetrahydropterin synthase [Streptosporangium saharense]MBB4920566.1 6-pyruvoyl-tetrahydropterin synthase [Streptosporangium saharense]
MSFQIEIGGGGAHVFSAAHAGIHDRTLEPLHGHTFTVTVRLHGDPDGTGMVLDFRRVKEGLREVIEPLKRRTLLPETPVVGTCHVADGRVIVECGDDWYSFPRRVVALLPVPNTTTEELAGYLLDRLMPYVDGAPGIDRVELVLAEAPDTRAVASVVLAKATA